MIGKRIKLLRTEKEVTQKELADFLGLTPKMKFPPHDIISKLSDYFNVTTDYLLCKTDKKNTLDETEEERGIEKAIDELLQQDGLMLCGDELDDEALLLLRDSIRTTIKLMRAKIGDTLIYILKQHKLYQKEMKLKYGQWYTNSNWVCTKKMANMLQQIVLNILIVL